jgi:GNAT superfamily N-acetyltransferase
MIEIRTFEGDAAELSDFTTRMWRKSYEGKMPIPLWSPSLFRRELLPTEDDPRDYLVAAYDGTRLVGSHPARSVGISLHGGDHSATWGSFLTVDPEYRRQGIAQKMHAEFQRRHRERGAKVNFGYLYIRSIKSMGPKFWLKQPEGTRVVRKLGIWGRALDHRAVARFELYRIESWGSRMLSPVQGRPKAPRDMTGIRPYAPGDLPDCLELVADRAAPADLAYRWSEEELARLLDWEGLSRTLVIERDGRVGGLVNYYRLELLGRSRMEAGVIDLLAFGSLAPAARRRLLRAALFQMAEDGLQAAIHLRGSWYAWRSLLGAGFAPFLPEYYYVGNKMDLDFPLEKVRRVHVVWR